MPPATRENPNGYWCQKCGRSREHAAQWCSSAYCKERRDEEDNFYKRHFTTTDEEN